MAAQGPGHWLNPKTGKFVLVYRHELDIRKESVAKMLGVSDSLYAQIMSFNQAQANEIRLLAMKAGLIRLRDNPVYSIQFYLPRRDVREALWSIYQFFQEASIRPWSLWINNLLTKDEVTISYEDLVAKLKTDEPVLVHETLLDPPTAVPPEAVESLRKLFDL